MKKDSGERTIGKVIAELRRERNMSQSEFADELAKYADKRNFKRTVSLSAVSMWEQGLREPRKEMRELICDFFNVDIAYLYGKSIVKNVFQSKGNQIKIYNQYDNTINDDKYVVDTMILPECLVEPDTAYFALIVSDSNLNKDGIKEGDIIVYRKTNYVAGNTVECVRVKGRIENHMIKVTGDNVSFEDEEKRDEEDEEKNNVKDNKKFNATRKETEVLGMYVIHISK